MQSAVYERKQNGEDFFSLPAITYSRFGNWMANVLVTEKPQYSVVICVFSIWQNTETMLISNGLRFIFTCPLFLAQPITFHLARHTWATIAKSRGIPVAVISEALGHASVSTTEGYLKRFEDDEIKRANKVIIDYIFGK